MVEEERRGPVNQPCTLPLYANQPPYLAGRQAGTPWHGRHSLAIEGGEKYKSKSEAHDDAPWPKAKKTIRDLRSFLLVIYFVHKIRIISDSLSSQRGHNL